MFPSKKKGFHPNSLFERGFWRGISAEYFPLENQGEIHNCHVRYNVAGAKENRKYKGERDK